MINPDVFGGYVLQCQEQTFFKSTLLKLGEAKSFTVFIKMSVWARIHMHQCHSSEDCNLKSRDLKRATQLDGKHETIFQYRPLRKTMRLREKEPQAIEQQPRIDLIARKQIRKQERVLSVRSPLDDFKFIYTNEKVYLCIRHKYIDKKHVGCQSHQ